MKRRAYGSVSHRLSFLPFRVFCFNHIAKLFFLVFSLGWVWPGIASEPGPNQQQGSRSISLEQALKATVERHPSLQIQHWEIEIARGARRQAAGQFDTLLQSSLAHQRLETPQTQIQSLQTPSGTATSTIPNNDTVYNFNISKLLRNGISISSFSTIDRTSDPLLAPVPFSTSQVGTSVVFPLLRARGERAVTATEVASSIEVTSREWDLEHTLEQLLANTAVSYWSLVAAQEQLKVAAGSEARGKVLVDTVQALIDADQVPRNDIHEVTANLADRVANRITVEQAIVQTRQQLGLNMGLSGEELIDIGNPSDGFPPLDENMTIWDEDPIRYYVQEAMSHRPDLRAAERREAEARSLLLAARNATQPQLNLQFSLGYTQLRESSGLGSFFESLVTSGHRPDVRTGILYQFAQSNNVAKGQMLQAQARVHESELQSFDLKRQVTAAVRVALYNVRSSVARVKSEREAVRAFQKALDGEREKFRLGQASLTEVLTIEDRLTTALSSEVNAEQAYALALTALRLATGTLLPGSGPIDNVDPRRFQTVPSLINTPQIQH